MRIISQKGIIDVPYENVTLRVEELNKKIYVVATMEHEEKFLIGNYETEQRAIGVLRDIREKYHTGYTFYKMPKE